CTALIVAISSVAQSTKNTEQVEKTVVSITKQIGKSLKAQKAIGAADMSAFKDYYEETILWDRGQLFKNIEDDSVNNKNTTAYVNLMVAKYAKFYDQYMMIPASNRAILTHKTTAVSPPWPGACNPGCNNTDFENGTLSGWMGCYATNNSGSSSGFSYTSTNCTGILGAVTTAAVYPTTGLPQLNITSAASGNDPVVGAALPQLCPIGGKYSCEIGDYNNPN